MSLEEARANHFQRDWSQFQAVKPIFTSTRIINVWVLEELARGIDWTPFFQTWDLKGYYPALLDDEEQGAAVRHLFDDAQVFLKQIIAEAWFKTKAVCGFSPAHARMDDVVCYMGESRTQVMAILHTLRQ